MDTSNNRRTVGYVVFYTVHAVSNDSLFSDIRQRLSKNVAIAKEKKNFVVVGEGIVFHVIPVVSTESSD
jgi:predicted RNase H-related nuclease YkuK (DUF458 family)